MAEAKKDHTANGLLTNDTELKEKKAQYEALKTKHWTVADAPAIARAKAALEEKKIVVHVVDDAKAALAKAQELLGDGKSAGNADGKTSFSFGGSETLQQIGLVDWAKTQTTHTNYKGLAVANYGKPEYGKYLGLGSVADWYFSSADAISQDGHIVWSSATGTRVSLRAGHTVFVVGAQKIVPTLEAANTRSLEWSFPLESARCRAVYGTTGSSRYEIGHINSTNPFGSPGALQVIIVKAAVGY